MVEVILLERVEKLGQMGQVVKVRPGFARNYLLPQKKALRATKENMAYFEKQRTQLEAQNLARRSEVVLDKAIKTLGLYPQRVVLHPEVAVSVTVNVAQSAEEAEMQVKGVDPVRLAQEAAAREVFATADAVAASAPEAGVPAAETE